MSKSMRAFLMGVFLLGIFFSGCFRQVQGEGRGLGESALNIPPAVQAGQGSMVFSAYAPALCLAKTSELLGQNRWQGINPLQKVFLQDVYSVLRDTQVPGLKAEAVRDSRTLNAFLEAAGADLKVPDFEGIGCGVFLEVPVAWPFPAEKKTITLGKRKYAAFTLNNRVIERFDGPNQELVVRIATQQSGLYAYVALLAQRPQDTLTLTTVAATISHGKTENVYGVESLTMPMVDFEADADVSWLVGLKSARSADYVGYAKARSKLEIDDLGAHGSVVMTAITYKGSSPDLVIDRPFLFWIEQDGEPAPRLVAWLEPDAWARPKR